MACSVPMKLEINDNSVSDALHNFLPLAYENCGDKKANQDHCIDKNMTTLMMASSLRHHILQQLKDLMPSLWGRVVYLMEMMQREFIWRGDKYEQDPLLLFYSTQLMGGWFSLSPSFFSPQNLMVTP